MKVYASAVRRRERLIGVALREFDAALDWAAIGSGEPVSVDSEPTGSDEQPAGNGSAKPFPVTRPDSSAG